MTDRQVDLFGWSETNTEWTNYHTNNRLYKAFKQEFRGGKWVPVTSTIIFPSHHKPGGNLVGCNNRTSSRCLQQVKDKLGRWAGLVLQGHKRKLLILQLYIPIKAEGVYTTYTQQRQQLDNSQRHEESVHKAYFTDLRQLLNKHTNSEKLLMGDFNSEPTDKSIADLQTDYQLQDLYAQFHSVINFNTHRDGSKRIDYVLATKGITYSTRKIGYEGNSFLPPSDHRAMFVDIRTNIFRNTTTPFRRNLNSKNASKVYAYRKKLNQYLHKTNVLSRLDQLGKKMPNTWKPQRDGAKLDRLDKEITRAMCKAEHKTQPCHTAPWSPIINTAYKQLQHINAKLRKLCPKPKGANNRYPPHNLAPNEHSEYRQCWTERQKVKKNLKQARENAPNLRKSYIQDKIDMEELKNPKVSTHNILVQI